MSLHDTVRAPLHPDAPPMSTKELAVAHQISPTTVRRLKRLAHDRHLTWSQFERLDDRALDLTFNKPRKGRGVGSGMNLPAVCCKPYKKSGLTAPEHMLAQPGREYSTLDSVCPVSVTLIIRQRR